MADTIALVITGAAQGLITGDNTQTTLGRENTIEVLSLTNSLRSAFERGTGKATGKRYYEPIRFTKRIDRSTPKLRGALTGNEVVSGKFDWFRSDSQNITEKFFTIEFTNGRIVSADAQLPNVLDAATASLPPLEVVELVFDTIKWTFINGGVEAEDMWLSQL
jgi:type VI secretion system secreted protein Hcp